MQQDRGEIIERIISVETVPWFIFESVIRSNLLCNFSRSLLQ
jgi:hypothetical protein